MGRNLAMVAVLLLLGAGSGAQAYRGADAGTLVISLGIMHGNKGDYRLEFRKDDGTENFEISYIPTSILEAADDYKNDNDETGQVQIRRLKPGNYSFYTFSAVDALVELKPHREFSVPFTIEPGKTTYIGDFAAVMMFDSTVPRAAYFVVSDKHERDLAIARKKEAALMPVTIAVPDPAKLNIVQIRSREIVLPPPSVRPPHPGGKGAASVHP